MRPFEMATLDFHIVESISPKRLSIIAHLHYLLSNHSRFLLFPEVGVATADVAATLVGYTAAHVWNLNIHNVVPVHDQLLNTHRYRFREQTIRGTRLYDIPLDAITCFLRQPYDLSVVVDAEKHVAALSVGKRADRLEHVVMHACRRQFELNCPAFPERNQLL